LKIFINHLFLYRVTIVTEQQNELFENKLMCNCESGSETTANKTHELWLQNEYNLPMMNRNLFVPGMMYWQNLTMTYFAPTNVNMPSYNDNCMNVYNEGIYAQIPTLNQLATSFNIEEINSKRYELRSKVSKNAL
jgi:hypothetical protein